MNRQIARPVVASSRRVTTVATVRRNQRRRPTGTGADPAWACRTVVAYGVGAPPPAEGSALVGSGSIRVRAAAGGSAMRVLATYNGAVASKSGVAAAAEAVTGSTSTCA